MCVGRIHSAMVTKVNLEASSVTVEWFEKGEVKGKEASYAWDGLYYIIASAQTCLLKYTLVVIYG